MNIPKNTLTILGILVALLAFLGFPGSFKTPAFFILGLVIAYVSYQEHHHRRKLPSFKRGSRKLKGAVSLQVSPLSEDSSSSTPPSHTHTNEENITHA